MRTEPKPLFDYLHYFPTPIFQQYAQDFAILDPITMKMVEPLFQRDAFRVERETKFDLVREDGHVEVGFSVRNMRTDEIVFGVSSTDIGHAFRLACSDARGCARDERGGR